ncbi:MAG: class I SAM-dependent methyltransferase [Ignavibacteriaceae bacterium]|jgi:ubiquinone/menaquinone biosynthesis C-methylase UbiE
MSKDKRWAIAQEYEKEWWDKRSDSVDFEFYKNFAGELLEFGKEYLKITDETVILEVGSGAGGIVTYLTESKNRYAIDPLENFYATVPKFVNQRDQQIKYLTAKGEDLPFEDKMFDLIIMDNVLDHCDNPVKVMAEVTRVIKDKGTIYFKQNTYHAWGQMVRYLMERVQIDKGHPFTFSKNDLFRILSLNELKLIKTQRVGYYPTWKKEFMSRGFKNKMKAILFATRDKITYLLQKV